MARIKVIVVDVKHQEVIEGNYPCILNEGFYLIPYDQYEFLDNEGIGFMIREIKDVWTN